MCVRAFNPATDAETRLRDQTRYAREACLYILGMKYSLERSRTVHKIAEYEFSMMPRFRLEPTKEISDDLIIGHQSSITQEHMLETDDVLEHGDIDPQVGNERVMCF
jgi:hypothetical protein